MINNQEKATVLCALRLMQNELEKVGGAGHIAQSEYFKDMSPLDNEQINDLCEKINVKENMGSLAMQDSRMEHDQAALTPGDDVRYQLHYQLGNQTYLRINDTEDKTQLDLILEINHGVPAIHISDQADGALLHIHRAQDGLVLTPDSQENAFKISSLDRYSYNDSNSLTIK